MYKVFVLMDVKADGQIIDQDYVEYSGITWACELDALDEYTKARLEGYTCMIKEV